MQNGRKTLFSKVEDRRRFATRDPRSRAREDFILSFAFFRLLLPAVRLCVRIFAFRFVQRVHLLPLFVLQADTTAMVMVLVCDGPMGMKENVNFLE